MFNPDSDFSLFCFSELAAPLFLPSLLSLPLLFSLSPLYSYPFVPLMPFLVLWVSRLAPCTISHPIWPFAFTLSGNTDLAADNMPFTSLSRTHADTQSRHIHTSRGVLNVGFSPSVSTALCQYCVFLGELLSLQSGSINSAQ